MSLKKIGCVLIVAAACSALAQAQAPPPQAKPDSPDVRALIEKTKKAGGAMWAEEAHFFCEAPRANSATDPVIVPTKVFDNVWVLGNAGTVVYIVQTSAGLLTIDSLGAAQVETLLLPGFQALGLDPAQVKVIIAGHGHGDHVGGARYMQDHFGSKVYIGEADWAAIDNPAPPRGGGAPAIMPKHDQVLVDGQPVVLGDFTITPFAIPGHTPGAMGFTFPVKDNGKTYIAAMWGGTILTPGPISDEGLQTYLQSVAHFREATRKAKVEVEVQNHPLMDPIQAKLDRLQSRKKGDRHPFVVGEANYQRFLDVMEGCTQVNIARRK
ncbi:MAG: MBL fold metallo-hydrolase [Acidobacteria bacterium]|nr:MBL fold metallo-hydrolase [Acidobacteriota bacterium]